MIHRGREKLLFAIHGFNDRPLSFREIVLENLDDFSRERSWANNANIASIDLMDRIGWILVILMLLIRAYRG